jgi:hypothetical protein
MQERYKEGKEFTVRGEPVTLIEADIEEGVCLVRPHATPIDLVIVPLDDLE